MHPVNAPGGVEGFLSWLGDDTHQIDHNIVNARLHQETPLLLDDELVELAFKCGRDMWIYTNKRILQVDVQGWSGKRVQYATTPLRFATCFRARTSGLIDRDEEISIFFDGLGELEQDLRKGKADMWQIHTHLQSKLIKP